MAIHFNEDVIETELVGSGVSRRRLITAERVPGTNILVDRWSLHTGGVVQTTVPARSLAWFFVLSGQLALRHSGGVEAIGESHTGFVAAGTSATIEAPNGAEVLYVEVPDAVRFDANYPRNSSELKVVDWTREPVLKSQHDARQRIYVATPKLFGTTAFKAEMIVYPAGTAGSNHHHEGCEHFKYIISGSGTGYTNEKAHVLRAGDIVYHYDLERHYSETRGTDLRFIEFFVPGEFKTIWVNEERICAWIPSGKDARGGIPVRHIKGHSSADIISPADV